MPLGTEIHDFIEDINKINTAASQPAQPSVTALDFGSFESTLNEMIKKANSGDEAAQEKLWNYFASEMSRKSAQDWTAARENDQYQRLMADLQKAGISPYILTGGTPGVSSSTGVSYSGSQMASQANSKRTQRTANADRGWQITKQVLSLVGTALFFLAMA